MARYLGRLPVYLSAVALQVALATPLHAQTTPPAASQGNAGLEEVVVTAQRREEKLNDVPMTVSVYSQENLDQQGIKNIDDLSRISPGVTFIRNGMGASANYNDQNSDISIRGIDSAAGAATTGIYVDDTPIQTRHLNFGTVIPYPALFDVERVEVLKGPQGTLFGAGSEGGTLRFITPDPGLHDYSVYARAEYGSIDNGGSNYEAGLAVGGPIIDGVLGFRVSASYREDGGWVNRVSYAAPPSTSSCYYTVYCPPNTGATLYNGVPTETGITEANANWHDTSTFRLALKWAPSDNLTVMPSIYVQTLHLNDTGAYWNDFSNPSANEYNNGNIQRNPSTDPWYLGAVKVEWSVPGANLSSNTSYYSRAQHSTSDYTQWFNTVFAGNQYASAANAVSAYFTDRQDNFTQEFRASSTDASARLQWTAGLYYSHVHENSTEYIHNPSGAGGIDGGASGIVYYQPVFSIIDKQIALFGEVSYNVTDQWKLTAGLRASRIESDGVVQETGSLVENVVVNSVSSNTERPVTPRFVINYKPTPDNLLYASAAKGFRPGGVNPELPPACGQVPPPTFSSDSLWLYEVGSKNTLFEHRVQFNASAYYLQWKNIQQFVYLACGLGFVPNLGQVDGKGGDVELHWRTTDNLTLGAVAAYTDAAYTSNLFLNGLPLVTSNDHLPASPWNLDASLEYVFPMEKQPYIRFDFQYATAQKSLIAYQDPALAPNSDPTLPGLPEIHVLSVRAGLRFAGADISVFGQNLLNYHTPTFVSRDLPTIVTNPAQTPNWPYGSNFDTNYFGRGFAPRTIGISATYRH